MDTNTYTAMITRLGIKIANALADMIEAERPKHKEIARARALAMAEAANVMGKGITPAEVHMNILDWVVANPRPAATAMNGGRKGWAAAAAIHVGSILAQM